MRPCGSSGTEMLPGTASVRGPRKGVLSGGRSAPLPVLAAGVSLSLQLPTDCCEEENGQAPRARTSLARARRHTHTYTLTPARSLTPGSHPSIEKHTSRARLLPALPPSTDHRPPPPHHSSAAAEALPLAYSFKGATSQAPRAAGAQGRGVTGWTCYVGSRHTHIAIMCTFRLVTPVPSAAGTEEQRDFFSPTPSLGPQTFPMAKEVTRPHQLPLSIVGEASGPR